MTSSGKLIYESLSLLADPMAAEPYRLRSRLPGDAEAQGVDLNALSRGESQTKGPIQFDAAQGSKATNILWTQLVTPVCVSGRVIRILSENEVSGWSTYPVEVFDPEGELLADYHGLVVTGGVCDADYSRSAVITKPPPAPRGKSYDVYKGLFFCEDQWDGSDMFWVGGVRVVVDKVKTVFEKSGIENVAFTPLPEREIRVGHVR
ncbi:MAG: hypothetical protein OXH98_15150 [Caldilineaceae bacterium]|nr:hypothetical protein [Caldilineaceae bacterium]